MGWYIFRRTFISTIALYLFLVLTPALADWPEWLAQGRSKGLETSLEALPSEDWRGGREVFSFYFTRHKLVAAELERLLTGLNRSYLQELFRRADKYRGFIVNALKEKGLPPELFWLVMVESEFQVKARSASGALGLWQLMDFTARNYGLIIDEIRDERCDLWKATEAALALLQWNYQRFGDWLLAMAAYNAGGQRVENAIKKTGSRDFFVLAEKQALPAETINFVPRILAIIILAHNRVRFGLPLTWQFEPGWERIKLDFPLDLKTLAEKAAVPYELLLEANAELKTRLTPPWGAEYYLKIPAEYAARVREVLACEGTGLLAAASYQIKTGDSFYGLARYYGISLELLMAYNPGVDPLKLMIGSRIIIPFKEKEPLPPLRLLTSGLAYDSEYEVKPGDTLYSIASRYKVSVEELARQNGLELSSTIRPKDRLKVPSQTSDK